MTNYDRIKAMSVEEMAKDRVSLATDDRAFAQYDGDFDHALELEAEWLQQEATE